MRRANNSVKNGSVFLYDEKRDKERLGGNQESKVEDGDICVAFRHSGDYFNDYMVIKKENGKFKKVGGFSSYVFGECLTEINEKDFYQLLGEQKVKIDYLDGLSEISKEIKEINKKEKKLNEVKNRVKENLENFSKKLKI
jgi:hypothetical protein